MSIGYLLISRKQVLHPFNKQNKQNVTTKFNRMAIEEGKYVQYLGVLIHSPLSWKYHINELGKKVQRVIGIMYKFRHYVPEHLMIILYYSLIYPYLIKLSLH